MSYNQAFNPRFSQVNTHETLFMSKRDTDLEVGTNSDGKAHFEGLPDELKKPPMEFTIHNGDATKSVTNDPATNCHPTFAVTLGK